MSSDDNLSNEERGIWHYWTEISVMSMRIVSYNCRGLDLPNQHDKLYSRPGVVEILNNNDVDIVCLQETWHCHTKQDLASLNNLHRKFHGIGESTVDDRDGLKLNFRKYPAIHTHYSWSNCTISN